MGLGHGELIQHLDKNRKRIHNLRTPETWEPSTEPSYVLQGLSILKHTVFSERDSLCVLSWHILHGK